MAESQENIQQTFIVRDVYGDPIVNNNYDDSHTSIWAPDMSVKRPVKVDVSSSQFVLNEIPALGSVHQFGERYFKIVTPKLRNVPTTWKDPIFAQSITKEEFDRIASEENVDR